MISAIRDIGTLVDEKNIKSPREGIIVTININNYNYSHIHIEDFDINKREIYLYKEGASKGNNPAPFCPLNLKEPEKALNKNITWLQKCDKEKTKNSDLNIRNIVEILNKQKDIIITDISEKIKNIKNKNNKFLTMNIDGKFLGEYEFFRDIFQELEIKFLAYL